MIDHETKETQMDEKKTRARRPSPAQLRAAAFELESSQREADDLTAEALAATAAWLRHEAAKGAS